MGTVHRECELEHGATTWNQVSISSHDVGFPIMADSWFSRLLARSPDPAGRLRKPPPPGPARPATTSRTNLYQAVGVVAGGQACAAACAVRGVRFLARQAPQLPLPDCDRQDRCRCRFEKFVDRRALMQRSPYAHFVAASFGGVDQRHSHGRRTSDR